MTSCCEDPACSHAVMAAAKMEASKLTDKEREIILGVLAKDEMLRRQQQLRVMRLKAELQSLRRKGALKPSASTEGAGAQDGAATPPPPPPASGRSCGRCRAELGRVINRGAACRACRLHVCKQCREYSHRATDWVCTVCHKHMEIQAASGEWMNEFVRRPSRRRDHKVYVPAADIIKRTIRRSWTISNPTPRWSALRGSPEHRPYNSLPRAQDISDYPSLVRPPGNRSPVRRTQSEDVYGEKPNDESVPAVQQDQKLVPTSSPQTPKRQQRVNPLMVLGNNKSPERSRKTSPRRRQQEATSVATVDVDEPDKEVVVEAGATNSRKSSPETSRRQPRLNPLMALAEKSPKESRRSSPARAKAVDEGDAENVPQPTDSPVKPRSPRISSAEKRVSFEGGADTVKLATTRAQSLPEGSKKEKKMTTGSRSLPEESSAGLREETVAEVHFPKEDAGPVELCDIEPISGTVFRKVTVRRRRQENMRKVAAVDTGILDILLPDGDDYRLVFLNSDSSSKEEEHDEDSSSTASSFPIDECDWDYFEPGATSAAAAPRSVLSWASSASPFGSPGVYRRGVGVLESPIGSPLVYRRIRESSDEDTTRLDSNSPSESLLEPPEHNEKAEEDTCAHQEQTKKENSCQTCGAITQHVTTTHYIPIPVPVPIPFPVPTVWAAQDTLVLYGPTAAGQLTRFAPRTLWQYVGPPPPTRQPMKQQEEEEEEEEEEDGGSSAGDDNNMSSTSGCSAEDTDSGGDAAAAGEKKTKKFSKVFVVNASSASSSSCASDSSDDDTDTEMDCGVVLTSIKVVDSEGVLGEVKRSLEDDKENKDDTNLTIERNILPENVDKKKDDGVAMENVGKHHKRRRRRNKLSNSSLPDDKKVGTNPKETEASLVQSEDKVDTTDKPSVDIQNDGTIISTRSIDKQHVLSTVISSIQDLYEPYNIDTQESNLANEHISDDKEKVDTIHNQECKPVDGGLETSKAPQGDSDYKNVSLETLLANHDDEKVSNKPDNLDSPKVTSSLQRDHDVTSFEEQEYIVDLSQILKEDMLDVLDVSYNQESVDSSEISQKDDATKTTQAVENIILSRDIESCDQESQGDVSSQLDDIKSISSPPQNDQDLEACDQHSFETSNNLQNVVYSHQEMESCHQDDIRSGGSLQESKGAVLSDTKLPQAQQEEETLDQDDFALSESIRETQDEDSSQPDGTGLGARQDPKTGDQDVENGDQDAENGDQDPETGDQDAETGHQDAETGHQDAETGHQDPETVGQGAETVDQDAETGDQDPDIADPDAETADQGGVWRERRQPHGYASSPGLSDASAESAATTSGSSSSGGGSGDEERRKAPPGGTQCGAGRHAARYTSLVMITQGAAASAAAPQVSVVTTDTTRLVGEVVVRHTNGDDGGAGRGKEWGDTNNVHEGTGDVTIITGADTLSAFEEGLADDDSWVENLSHDDDDDEFETNSPTDDSSSGEEVTLTCSAALDQEDELRGYHRTAIDFTLHTIVEESCEDSEVEQTNTRNRKERPASATDLEKYFFFGLGDGTVQSLTSNRTEDAFSETSSIYSEGMDSLGGPEENQHQTNDNSSDPADLASSRLEKYFLSGFMGFTGQRRDSDGSVGSDSEGKPSPEQRRKRLVRARGSGRSHSSSLDNLLANPDLADQPVENLINSEDSSSSDSDTYDESLTFEKNDGQFDTVKRKKAKKSKNSEEKSLETTQEVGEERDSNDEDGHKTPQPEASAMPSNLTTNRNQQSRDSGFIGSCDDLLKEQRDNGTPELGSKNDTKVELEKIEEKKEEKPMYSTPPATSLTRKDSFNNWSSDEETNLMMCKMRQFFKTMVANSQHNSKPSTPNLNRASPKPLPSPRSKARCKPPQLLYFEGQLTKLMKTVPGIRDDQVREIVEYLSSEDTWSDSYDSSDYTSSDLEGTASKSALQQQISDSCQQIIEKFDGKSVEDEEGDEGDGGIVDETQGLNKETAFVYQKLVASIEKMASGNIDGKIAPHNSPPLIAKVMHHIGSRLVALMHEVSSGESHASNSPKARHYHRRLQQKLSNASTTTDDDSTDSNFADVMEEVHAKPCGVLPRSRSHDLLLSEARTLHQSSSGVSDIAEERGEASDCERFSWRGSFESALLASDSRNRLSLIEVANVSTAAKRRSAGDLLFAPRSASREQLDRVRSCGSIGEGAAWSSRRRSSVPDCNSGGSADGEDEDEETGPGGLQAPTTNSLPRLPTGDGGAAMQKAQSMHHFLPQAKSARYRPPGFSRLVAAASGPKRAVSAPGLQPSHQRRGRRSHQHGAQSDDVSVVSETAAHSRSSPTLATARVTKSATPSPAPATRRGGGSTPAAEWHGDDDVDRLVAMHHQRSSLSSLGLRSDSMASVYSGAGDGRYGSVAVRGQVEFGLQYNYKAGALEILVRQCKDLAPVDVKRNRSDPYVKVYLLPDKSKSGKRKTKVKKHTLNPVFEECLRFHISLNGLETRTLWLTVWHSDMFGRNDFLGEVTMALENKVFDDPTPKWYSLQERTEPFDDIISFKGDIIVCLKFVPPDMTVHKKGKRSRGTLHVLIKEAKALTAVKAHGHSDPFCKSYLLPDKGRNSKQKTPVAKRTVNPVWNYTFMYDDVTLQELAERCLELTVWDHDRLASNEFLGGIRFSLGTGKHYGKAVDWMDASGKELSLWKSMLERPNFWVEGCVALRPTLDTRAS